VLGFVIGAALVVPGIFVALLVPVAERVSPFLTPAAALLRPLSGPRADWPGAVNILLLAAVNGLVWGAVAICFALVLHRVRRSGGAGSRGGQEA
jgi:hypothetical protein